MVNARANTPNATGVARARKSSQVNHKGLGAVQNARAQRRLARVFHARTAGTLARNPSRSNLLSPSAAPRTAHEIARTHSSESSAPASASALANGTARRVLAPAYTAPRRALAVMMANRVTRDFTRSSSSAAEAATAPQGSLSVCSSARASCVVIATMNARMPDDAPSRS